MNPSPITPEAKAELERILDSHAEFYIRQTVKFFEENGGSPKLSRNNPGDVQAKQSLIRLLVRERVEGGQGYNRAFTGALGKPTYMNDEDGRQTVYKQEWVSAAVREANNGIAHLESLLQEDNPPIW